MTAKFSVDFDPLEEAIRPPLDETECERNQRVAQETEAKRISNAIDESLRLERQERKKRRVVRLLLLGQSESGKSTTLRHFQRLYTPNAFREERILWRSVIQLNIVRTVHTIIDALSGVRRHHIDSGGEESEDGLTTLNNGHGGHGGLSQELEFLQMRLAPLRHVERLLIAKLVPPGEDEALALPPPPGISPSVSSTYGSGHRSQRSKSHEHAWRTQEVFVRPGTRWKGAVGRSGGAGMSNGYYYPHDVAEHGSEWPSSDGDAQEARDEAQETLAALCGDIMALWNDRFVREVLKRRKIRLEEFPGFFLNDLERVTALKYIPSDDDVLRARLKTVGVSEYRFEMEAAAGRESGTEWRIIDVGGSRSQRATWIPFFDDVDAIIFLAPISGFDQVLAEDRSVNRLEDSVLLWKSICANKLLANVELVLFLNKCDIMDAKLRSGVRLSKYVRSYGERANDLETASKYFRSKFSAIHREYSPLPRKFYGFCTSVTDTSTTAGILASVRDMVVRRHLKQSRLL